MNKETLTERLRKLLDACKVSWTDYRLPLTDSLPAHGTIYETDGITWVALENPEDHSISVTNFRCKLSPEQVVKATIGRGKCHPIISDNLNESEGTGDVWANCSECGALLYVGLDKEPRYCPNCGRQVME